MKSDGFRLIALLGEGLVALPTHTLPQCVCAGAVGPSGRAAGSVHTPGPQDTCSSWVYGRSNCKLLAWAVPQAAADERCQTCHVAAVQGCSRARLSFTGMKNRPDFYTILCPDINLGKMLCQLLCLCAPGTGISTSLSHPDTPA